MTTISPVDELADVLARGGDTARAGIVAGETYFTAFSVAQRKGRRLVPGSDEDAVTMAVEAGQGALATWGGTPASVDGLYLSLDHGPELADANPQAVREALGLPMGAKVVTFNGDLGGLDALQAAIAAADAGGLSTILVVAAEQAADQNDRRHAAAAALMVRRCDDHESAIGIEELARAGALTHSRWRDSALEPQEPDFRFLSHRYRQVVDAVLEDARGRGVAPVDELIFSGGTSSDHRAVQTMYFTGVATPPAGRSAGVDYGVAGPLVALLGAARGNPGRTVGLIAHGSGQAVFLRFRVPSGEEAVFGTGEPPVDTRAPVESTAVGPALALPAESPFFHRGWNETLRLEAGRCERCETVMYPPSQRPICSNCGSTDLRPFALPRRGTVYTFVDNRFNPAGFPARVVSVLAELEGGYRFWAPMPPETRGEDVFIGLAVELRLRRFTSRHGLPVYALKYVEASPAPSGSEPDSRPKGSH